MSKRKSKRKLAYFALLILKPFIIPILIIAILLALVTTITDILYIAFNGKEEVNIEEELKYYDVVYEENVLKEFFTSVWEFVSNLFGSLFAEDADWPVERTL